MDESEDDKRSGEKRGFGGSADLVVEPAEGSEKDSFSAELERTLRETEEQVRGKLDLGEKEERSWERAREIVGAFVPVPWFIWRLSNFVFSSSNQTNNLNLPQGLVLGLRRLLFAAASDEVFGSGKKVNNVREALRILPADLIAAVSVIHAICRRLATRPSERIWRPVLDDAVLRCRIGEIVGGYNEQFGRGRGMLAGFSARSGLAVLLSSGELEQARKALELLAGGEDVKNVGFLVYQCDPLQISALILSAAGCGRDAAFGVASYGLDRPERIVDKEEQLLWLAAFSIVENLRMGSINRIRAEQWEAFGLSSPDAQQELQETTKKIVRRGHSWSWLV